MAGGDKPDIYVIVFLWSIWCHGVDHAELGYRHEEARLPTAKFSNTKSL